MLATKRLIGLTFLMLLAVGLTGCGPGTATVSGEVTYNGAPVTG